MGGLTTEAEKVLGRLVKEKYVINIVYPHILLGPKRMQVFKEHQFLNFF